MKTVAFLGNYAPRCCGIATFTQDLRSAVLGARPGLQAPVTMMCDGWQAYSYPEEVSLVINENNRVSYALAAEALNRSDASVVSLQHEYGIFGGPSGAMLLDLMKELRLPVVTTCHTVLREPSPEQHQVMCAIARHSTKMVVMAEKGRAFLREIYRVPDQKIVVIPHGIPSAVLSSAQRQAERATLGWSERRVLFTFGLLAPNKGIEYAVRALPEIVREHPDVLYVVAGATHPNLVREQGEQYRESLRALAEELGVSAHLQFIDRFVSRDELINLIAAADVYTTPYLNEAQITSGTLAYAFGMGKPVISTPYWHAAELLADDHGVLVPFRDSAALAAAATALLSNETMAQAMRERAFQKGREMTWQAVGQRYAEVFEGVASAASQSSFATPVTKVALPPLNHFERMMGTHGMYQHARFTEPDLDHGFCTDDNARAAICLTDYLRAGSPDARIPRLFDSVFRLLVNACDLRTGRFRNFMDQHGNWLEYIGSEDSHGRALWALGHIARHHPSSSACHSAVMTLRAGAPATIRFTSPRAWAFAILGLTKYLETQPEDQSLRTLRDVLVHRIDHLYKTCAVAGWHWFENSLTYDNAKLSQAMLAAARQTGNPSWRDTGLRSLQFLVKAQTAPDGHFRSIGSDGFWQRHEVPAQWDQQPLEAQATTAACLEACAVTGQEEWYSRARHAFDWFTGGNDHGFSLCDEHAGSCCDGLQENRLNLNLGAESTLAWLQASAEMRIAERRFRATTLRMSTNHDTLVSAVH